LGAGARFGEAIAGTPGTLLNMGLNAARHVLDQAGNDPIHQAAMDVAKSLTGAQGEFTTAPQAFRKVLGEGEVPYLPTQESLHQKTKQYTGEALEPKGLFGEFIQGFASDLGSTFGKGPGVAALANVASSIAKYANLSPETGGAMKMAIYLGAPLMGVKKTINNAMEGLYQETKAAAGQHTIDAGGLLNFTKKAQHDLKGDHFKGKEDVNGFINAITERITGQEPTKVTEEKGFIDPLTKIFSMKPVTREVAGAKPAVGVAGLWDIKKQINEEIGRLMGSGNSTAIDRLRSVKQEIESHLFKFGKTHPEFGKPYSQAEDLYKALHNQSQFTQTLTKGLNAGKIAASPLIHLVSKTHALDPATIAAGLGIGYTTKNLAQSFDILSKSKTAQQLAAKMFMAGTKKNLPATIRYANQLSKTLDKGSAPAKGTYRAIDLE
jgi:hypothetical protein